jgi:hypothetical protein
MIVCYNATSNLVRFENIFFYFELTL